MDVEVEHPHVHHHSGHRWIDMAIPIAALFVSVVSIAIAYHHGSVMQQLVRQNERLVQANSLPYLELGTSTRTQEGEPRISLFAINSGVGPAAIKSVEVLVDGRPVSDLRQLLAACCAASPDARVGSSTLSGRMVRAGDMITYVDFLGGSREPLARSVLRAYRGDRIKVNLCYCSVFGECWTRSSTGLASPTKVAACPSPAVGYEY